MERILTSPGGKYFNIPIDIINSASHTLIAGASGSGKSVALNNMIYSVLAQSPSYCRLVLIDPKKVELSQYKKLPIVDRYADSLDSIRSALLDVCHTMDNRYKEMQRTGDRMYQGTRVLVVIDELADLMLTEKRTFLPLLQKIGQLGRACKINLIACTQSPSRYVIPAALQVNFSHKVGLRCDSAIESRQVIGQSGCEFLPRYGKAIMKSPDGVVTFSVDMVPDVDIQTRIDQWLDLNKASVSNMKARFNYMMGRPCTISVNH